MHRLAHAPAACFASRETKRNSGISFRLLGPFEAEAGGGALPLGGRKQRAVLALLLLRANEAVPLERLIDDVWGDDPPASAAHALEAYVSRLRVLLEPHGPSVVRSGRGYRLDLAGADVDTRRFEALLAEADRTGSPGRAAELIEAALALWRGPLLADTPLLSAGRAEVGRIEELRLHALELSFDAALESKRHHELVGELRSLVEEHPLRERFVRQLMLALYRSGRQADALDVYEQLRRALGELGLHPSRDLQELSGAIVRQEDELERPARTAVGRRPIRSRRVAGVTLAVAAAAAVAVAFAATRGTDVPEQPVAASGPRVAMLLPRAPVAGRWDPFLSPFIDGLRLAAHQYGLRTERIVGAESFAKNAANERLAVRLRQGDFDLVLVATPWTGGKELLKEVRRLPNTHFIFIDAVLHGTPYAGLKNVTAVSFADEQAGYLAGYLSGLVEADRSPRNGRRVISAVGGTQAVPSVEALVDGFARGSRRALPSVTVLVDYSEDFVRQDRCEGIANEQIDAGSDIVFAAAGTCGLGALAAASGRGVSGIGADEDYAYLGPHILASTIKRFDRAVIESVRWYIEGTLPPAQEVVLALDDHAVSLAIGADVPPAIRRQVEVVAAELRKRNDGRAP
jgi:DNA-binding SARP family transcriptional activator/basic membrane lipoprotein Med (substrate-binding protein (PBP1-ABC) superfamily)